MLFNLNFWLRCLAFSVLFVYFFWNIYFIFQLSFPPSMFLIITGLPCPTTGCLRSFNFLINGNFLQSLDANFMTVPLICVLLISIFFILKSSKRLLVPVFGKFWLVLLFTSWFLQLLKT